MVTVRELVDADVAAVAVCGDGVLLRTVEGELRKVGCEWRTVDLRSENPVVVDTYGSAECPPGWIVWTATTIGLA